MIADGPSADIYSTRLLPMFFTLLDDVVVISTERLPVLAVPEKRWSPRCGIL